MLGFALTFGAIVGSFVLPAIVGLALVSLAARYVNARYLAAFAVGIYLWFFSDTIGDASYLSVDESFSGGIFHVALWVLFAMGLVVMLSLDRDMFAQGAVGEKFGFGVPLLVAVAVGVHGFGEGAAIGATAAATTSTSLLDAFGGSSASLAFILHKGLEPMMVGAAYWVYAKDHAKNLGGLLRDILVLSAAFVLPGIIGGGSAYFIVQIFPSADFTYVFAFGLGTSIYALIRLTRPLFQSAGPSRFESTRMAVAVLLGFTCLYLAALLHS